MNLIPKKMFLSGVSCSPIHGMDFRRLEVKRMDKMSTPPSLIMSKVAAIDPTGMRVAPILLILKAIALTLHMNEKTLIEKMKGWDLSTKAIK